MFDGDSVFSAPGLPMENVVDPTGAGDSFAGGFMGSLAIAESVNEDALRRAIIYGSAIASFSICDFGPYHLAKLTSAEINNRYNEFYRLTRFDRL
jgi:sugar/nucleoside kinase (ribokinase family)